MKKIWDCKIGEIDAEKLPPGADAPMRAAIERTYYLLTGEYPQFIFSGWGGELTEGERRVVNNATPSVSVIAREEDKESSTSPEKPA